MEKIKLFFFYIHSCNQCGENGTALQRCLYITEQRAGPTSTSRPLRYPGLHDTGDHNIPSNTIPFVS